MQSRNFAAAIIFGIGVLHAANGHTDVRCAYSPFNLPGQCLRGFASANYASDSNRCVPKVIEQFNALKDHGEIMGFGGGGARISYPSLDGDYNHWQGIQRLSYPSDHRILMVLTGSSYAGANFAVVSFGTRGVGGFSGRRFGGNRMSDSTPDWNVPPPANDRIVQKGSTSAFKLFNHAGGIQALGQFLAIPTELIKSGSSADLLKGNPFGRTQLFDVGGTIDLGVAQCDGTTAGCIQTRWVFEHSQPGDGEVALAKLDDGRYLMINAITTQTKILEVNVSRLGADGKPLNISDPTVFGAWNSLGSGGQPSAVFHMDGLPDWKEYQSLQLVTECNSGQLFLIGIGSGERDSDDWADLYQLNLRVTGRLNQEREPVISTGYIKDTFSRVSRKHFWCTYRDSDRQCDFAAASGIYVDPFGTLILYASVHHNTGPGAGGTRFVEFAPNDPVDHPDTPSSIERCDKATDMWVELSNKPLSSDGVPTVGSDRFFIEYQNEARSHTNFSKAYNFNDRSASIRYCLPEGYRYKICSGTDYKGACTQVCGTSGESCSGDVSNGQVRGLNFSHPMGRSGCFTKGDSSACQ